jgi:phage recombination protein Bet
VVEHSDLPVPAQDWTPEREQFIRRTFVGNAPASVADLFLAVARRTGLAPEQRQIYLIRRGNDWVVTVGIDGLRLIAARTGQYAGSDAPQFEMGPDGLPVSATVTVYRLVQGHRCPFSAIAFWTEFAPSGDRGIWREKPRHMLGKVAEAHALRKAFPADLAGLYTPEELAEGRGPDEVVTVEVEQPAAPPERARAVEDRDKLNRKLFAHVKGLLGDEALGALHLIASAAWGVEHLRDLPDDEMAALAAAATSLKTEPVFRAWLSAADALSAAPDIDMLREIAATLKPAAMPAPARDLLRAIYRRREAALQAGEEQDPDGI